MGLKGCKFPVEIMPVTAVRHVYNGDFCFILLEYYQCIPEGSEDFVKKRTCNVIKRKIDKSKLLASQLNS
jgi:hypothetical protein